MKKMILFAVSLFAAGLLPAQEASTASDQVPIEEYVPKVIIEGKWGTGPGEFGVAWTYASDVNVPQDESGTIPPLYPSSLAVNSEGEIYILDSVNNRIQKFTADGTFIKSIPVDAYVGEEQPIWYGKVKGESGNYVFDKVLDKNLEGKEIGVDKWFPFFWPLTAQGINIVIDSKDNLYYYLKRVKDGKESGEVWQFRNDKLVKKWSLSDPKLPKRLSVSESGYREFRLFVDEGVKVSQKRMGEHEQGIVLENGIEKSPYLRILPRANMKSGGELAPLKPRIGKDCFVVPFRIYAGSKNENGTTILQGPVLGSYTYIYKPDGTLLSVVEGEAPNLDGNGNGYVMNVNDNKVIVTKFERVAKK